MEQVGGLKPLSSNPANSCDLRLSATWIALYLSSSRLSFYSVTVFTVKQLSKNHELFVKEAM
jgi:hypothetical protein